MKTQKTEVKIYAITHESNSAVQNSKPFYKVVFDSKDEGIKKHFGTYAVEQETEKRINIVLNKRMVKIPFINAYILY